MMVEAGAGVNVVKQIEAGYPAPTEATVAEGIEAAKPFIETLCRAQRGLADEMAKETKEFQLFPAYSDKAFNAVEKKASKKLGKLLTIKGKAERDEATNEYMEDIEASLLDDFDIDDDDREEYAAASKEIRAAYNALMKQIVREKILTEGFRIDGRGVTDIRDLEVEVQLIPRAHGSALFERCLLYTSPSPRDGLLSRMPSSA